MPKPHSPTALIYARGVSPQDVNDQLESCLAYCEEILGYRWIDDRHHRKAAVETYNPEQGTVLVTRRNSESDAIKIERDWTRQAQQTGRRRTLDLLAEYGAQLDLVVQNIESICRNRKHVDEFMDLLSDGITVHIVHDACTLHAPTNAARTLLEIGAGLSTVPESERVEPPAPATSTGPVDLEFADPAAPVPETDDEPSAATGNLAPPATSATATPRATIGDANDETDEGNAPTAAGKLEFPVRRPYTGGRPPKGFDVSDGGDEIVSNDHYRTIHTVIQSYRDGELSQRKAAEKLDCSRATVANLAERTDRYQLA